MSEKNDLDLDAILAEFYRDEQKPAPAPKPVSAQNPAVMTRRERTMAEEARSARTPREEPLLNSAQKAEEGTMVYTAKAARPAEAPAQPKPQPKTVTVETHGNGAQPRKAAPKTAKKPRRGRGFALMLLVLALLAAALLGLVRWTMRAEKEAQPDEPQAIRLELGADLERALDESASSSR